MKTSLQISRIIITLLVFVILTAWSISDNDPQWIFSAIVSAAVFIINPLSVKLCQFFINQGDKITNKILKVLYYALTLPLIFFLILCLLVLPYVIIINTSRTTPSLGTAILIAFIGIGIFTLILSIYFQTLIILILRHFMNSKK